jgi:DNA-binding transcriptional regulator YiaG
MGTDIIRKHEGGFFPNDIGNETLNQLVVRKDVEVHKKDNKLTLKRVTSSESVTIEVRTYPDATIVTQSKADRTRPVSQMQDTIKKMRDEGQTQADVADKLGTTQSNISKIEKGIKK